MSESIDWSKGAIFPIGESLPEMFSKYFIGQAHLNMLTTTGVGIGNVTFEPKCRNNLAYSSQGRSNSACNSWSWLVSGMGQKRTGTASGRCCEHSRQRLSIGTARPVTVGLHIWQLKFRQRELPTNGLKL